MTFFSLTCPTSRNTQLSSVECDIHCL